MNEIIYVIYWYTNIYIKIIDHYISVILYTDINIDLYCDYILVYLISYIFLTFIN